MGVTLERVQFKFASIIGELCSEPDILSQFAVWVDLRLAEYKLKGSISLDCSGETPDPIWLHGILSAMLAKKMASQKAASKPTDHNHGILMSKSHRNFSQGRSSASKCHRPGNFQPASNKEDVTSLSPLIKEEPQDEEIYPVGFHVHEVSGVGRKRSATETITSQEDSPESEVLYSHSTSKQRRPDAGVNVDNESLMSIIGVGDHSNNVSELSSDIIRNTTDRILESEEAASLNQEGSSLSQQDLPVFPVQMGQGASPGTNSVPDALTWHGWTFGAFVTPGSVNPDFVKAEAAATARSSEKLHIRKPFRYGVPSKVCKGQGRGTGPNNREDRTGLSCPDKNSRSSATIFERWLNSCSSRFSKSRVETIPPEELDGLLADFLAVVKKTSGGDYDAVSFSNLRYNLDRYLSSKGYGHVISKSPLFGRSQAVFNSRRSQLKAKASKGGGPLTFTTPPTLTPQPQPDEQQFVNSGSEENAQESS